MKRVVVTGASGFVGANLARRLLDEGHQVHLLLRSAHATWRIAGIRDDARCHIVDLCDSDQLGRIIGNLRPEWIFHLAAYGAYPQQVDLNQMITTNITATSSLLTACLNVGFEAFVHTGSSSEYGLVDHAPTEAEYIDPDSYYACTKAAATHLCRHIARAHEVHLPILRLYSAYGPFEEPTRLVPTLVRKALRGQLPPLVAPDTARDFVYIDDVCQAYLLAAAHRGSEPGAIYNVGSGTQTTIRQMVEMTREQFGVTAEPVWGSMAQRTWDTKVWIADHTKISRELRWQPHYPLHKGLAHTAEWFAQHQDLLPEPNG